MYKEGNVKIWASILDDVTRAQAHTLATCPVIHGDVALMADAHLGIGATVGSVIPTKDAIIPAAVGVDIGCGMIAVATDRVKSDLPEDLSPLIGKFSRSVPAGVGQAHKSSRADARVQRFFDENPAPVDLDSIRPELSQRAVRQLGSLGAGNHFLEVCLNVQDQVWVVIHSGSRGVGNILATHHIGVARGLMDQQGIKLQDKDLAYFMEDSAEGREYIEAMLWGQKYALTNREVMMDAALADLFGFIGGGKEMDRINCHHNFSAKEVHGGEEVWVTRKGAIRARKGDLGVIPGSMGAASYIVEGKGNPDSYNSSAHGAGRKFSRGQARRTFTTDSLETWMKGKAWNQDNSKALLDEHPEAYKDIDQVMEDQKDLVSVLHKLHQIVNYKGL
jgi:RNA-splicing ligase RtcB